MAGCGIEILRERELAFLTAGMLDSFKISGGMENEKQKSHVTGVTRKTATLTRRDRDKPHSEWS